MVKQPAVDDSTTFLENAATPFRLPPSRNDNETGSASQSPEGVAIGTLIGFDAMGAPCVGGGVDNTSEPLSARTIVPLNPTQIGQQVVVQFEGGDASKPIVMGVLRYPSALPIHVEVDGERLMLTADREIVLRCGEASITMTRAGKVIIRGTYLLNRSTGVNQIKGGSVQIN